MIPAAVIQKKRHPSVSCSSKRRKERSQNIQIRNDEKQDFT